MRRFALLLSTLALAACGSEAQDPSEPMPLGQLEHVLEQAKNGNFTLYVSNQSFERGKVDIKVTINGFVAVEEDFAVENQHNWVEFRFQLADGPHTLTAESVEGEALLEERFKVAGERWAVVDYWCCNDSSEPKFTFNISAQPIAFA